MCRDTLSLYCARLLNPAIRFLLLIQFRVTVGLERIPAVTGQVAGHTLDTPPIFCRAQFSAFFT